MRALADWLDDPQQVHPCHGAVSYAGLELLIGMGLSSLERRKVDTYYPCAGCCRTVPAETRPGGDV